MTRWIIRVGFSAVAASVITWAAVGPDRAEPGAARRGSLQTKVEAKLGMPLTAEQRTAISRAAAEMTRRLKTVQAAYVQRVAKLSGVAAERVQSMMPLIGGDNTGIDKNILPRLEQQRGKPLSQAEMEQFRQADREKRAAMAPIQDAFAAEVARIVGLPVTDVRPMLPKVGL